MKRIIYFSFILFFVPFIACGAQQNVKTVEKKIKIYSSTGDGIVYDYGPNSLWNSVWSGNERLYSNSYGSSMATVESSRWGNSYQVIRSFFPFNTSSIPDNIVITKATLNFYVNKFDGTHAKCYLVETFQNNTSTLSIDDYNKVGSIVYGFIGEQTLDQYNSIEITNPLIINRDGFTKIGLREEHDLFNFEPENGTDNRFFSYFSEINNPDLAPYLEITYTVEELVEPDPVIIVPGLMGSWKSNVEWKIDPILHTYDTLIEAMIKSGYELDEDLFIFPYEWRNDNTYTAELLKEKIDAVKLKTGKDKVDLVAHSMGGLISRYYVEGDNYENDVDQLIFLDTPHRGSPESYLTSEGGYITGWSSPIIKFSLKEEAVFNGYFNWMDYMKERVVSLGQLLPDQSYLNVATPTGYEQMDYPNGYPRNYFLENLNSESRLDLLSSRGSIYNFTSDYRPDGNYATVESINVGQRTLYSALLGLWEFGQPILLRDDDSECLVKGAGDGTVPAASLKSISGIGDLNFPDTSHRGIVTAVQNDVIETLTGERPSEFEIPPFGIAKRVFFIRAYSPVDFQVIDPNGKVLGKDLQDGEDVNEIEGAFYSGSDSPAEFATIINPVEGVYTVKVKGVGNGLYGIGADILEVDGNGQIEDNILKGVIIEGEEESLTFTYDGAEYQPEMVKSSEPSDLSDDIDQLSSLGEITSDNAGIELANRARVIGDFYEKWLRSNWLNKKVFAFVLSQHIDQAEKAIGKSLEREWISEDAAKVLLNDLNGIKARL